MRNVTQSWAPIWYHHRFHEFILVCEIIHIVYPHLSLSLHFGSISVEWLLYTMSWSRGLDGLMIFDTGYSFDIYLLYAGNSEYFIFLLTLISVDISALIIDYHYYTVMFHVSWCRLMIILCLSLALLICIVYLFTHWVFYNIHTTLFGVVYRLKL